MLARYGDRIRVVSQPNRGVSGARNAGARASSGEYIAFLDDDDQWMPEKLARSVPILDQDPNCVLVYNGVLKVDLAGTPLPYYSQTWGIDSPTLAQMLARAWNVVPSQFMVRREVFERIGGFDVRLPRAEDSFFLLRAREFGHFRYVPEVLLRKFLRPNYPAQVERDKLGFELFAKALRERYGAEADDFIREFRRRRIKLLKDMAHDLTAEGRPKDARRCLARVIYHQPRSLKAYRRYLKTFLPTPRRAHPRAPKSEA